MGTSIVVDSFALPVQGTETRVNAASEANYNEYMVEYTNGSDANTTIFAVTSDLFCTADF